MLELVLEKTLEGPLDGKEIQPVHPKGYQSWIFIGRTDAEAENSSILTTWCEELTHWKRPWCWGRLKVGGEGDDRGWDVWIAPPTQRIWVWVNSGSWWWTERPGMLQSLGWQRVGHNWVAELTDWSILKIQMEAQRCLMCYRITKALFNLPKCLQNVKQKKYVILGEDIFNRLHPRVHP